MHFLHIQTIPKWRLKSNGTGANRVEQIPRSGDCAQFSFTYDGLTTNALSDVSKYVIDGDVVNLTLQRMISTVTCYPGRFSRWSRRSGHDLAEQVDTAKPQVVRFVNLEAIANGPCADFVWQSVADNLTGKGVGLVGTVHDPKGLPRNIVSRIDKGLKTPRQSRYEDTSAFLSETAKHINTQNLIIGELPFEILG